MGALGIALIAVAVIVVAVLLIIFIRFLFLNYIISRILSFGCTIASFVLAFFLLKDNASAGMLIADIILSTLAYMFFVGPVIFDVEWDGSLNFDFDTGDIRFGTTGGFIMNTVASLGVVGGLYLFLSSGFPAIFFIVPILIFILNIGLLIYARVNWMD